MGLHFSTPQITIHSAQKNSPERCYSCLFSDLFCLLLLIDTTPLFSICWSVNINSITILRISPGKISSHIPKISGSLEPCSTTIPQFSQHINSSYTESDQVFSVGHSLSSSQSYPGKLIGCHSKGGGVELDGSATQLSQEFNLPPCPLYQPNIPAMPRSFIYCIHEKPSLWVRSGV